MTIITSEKEFKVHKLVLCSQSGYFARMFNGDWLVCILLSRDVMVANSSCVGPLGDQYQRGQAGER